MRRQSLNRSSALTLRHCPRTSICLLNPHGYAENKRDPKLRHLREIEVLMKHRWLILAASVLLLFACEKPPQDLVDDAIKAVETSAKNPDVITYAPDSLRAAQEKLDALKDEMDAQAKKNALLRRYETTQELAGEVKAAAELSLTDAIQAKELVKAETSALLEGFPDSILDYERALWAAKRVRGIKLEQDILTLADDSRTDVADAQKDFNDGSYAAAKAKALTIQQRLSDGASRISEAERIAKGW